MYAIAPAALGLVAGAALPLMAWRDLESDAARATTRPHLLVFAALPASALVLAVVATVMAAGSPGRDLALPLLALGAAALAQGVAQGVLTRRLLPRLAADPHALAPGLVLVAAPEVLTMGAFAWVVVSLSAGAAA